MCSEAQQEFQLSVLDIPTLNHAEIYAGKLCAALDRQHPRDLFDVHLLYQNGGLSDQIRQAFVVYVACSPRPIHELLSPNKLNVRDLYENEFAGMTRAPVSLNTLLETRERMISDLQTNLTQQERDFLLSIKSEHVAWESLPFENLQDFPALKWKLINVQRMNKKKRVEQQAALEKVLRAWSL